MGQETTGFVQSFRIKPWSGNFWEICSVGTEKNMTARDVTSFCAFFSAQTSGDFLHIFGVISLLGYTENLEKSGKLQKNPVETAARNCRCLSIVVVERALIGDTILAIWWGSFGRDECGQN